MSVKAEKLKELAKEIPYHYKPQTCKYGKATIVRYVDARDVQDLLDEVAGPENWKNDYKVINNNLYAGVSIKVEDNQGNSEWITKWDCGISANQEAEKSEASDSFKRASVHWGIGRFLYRGGRIVLKTAGYKNKEYPATNEGKILFKAEELNNYIKSKGEDYFIKGSNKINKNTNKDYEKPKSEPTYDKGYSYSDETIKRVSEISHGGKKGKECLKEYLSNFSKDKGYDYNKITQLDDSKINELIDYIEKIPPENL